MDKQKLTEIQEKLKELDLYSGDIDGLYGEQTKLAILFFQRLNPPLTVDGIAGKQTRKKLFIKPIDNKFRLDYSTQQITNKFGSPGKNLIYLNLPYSMKLAWNTGVKINRFICHEFIAHRLEAIFKDILDIYGKEYIEHLGLDLFGGCYNNRCIRGGNKLSTHAWALSIDLDPVHNQLKMDKSKARFADQEYNVFWSIVEEHGGLSMGKLANFDYMHIQFINGVE